MARRSKKKFTFNGFIKYIIDIFGFLRQRLAFIVDPTKNFLHFLHFAACNENKSMLISIFNYWATADACWRCFMFPGSLAPFSFNKTRETLNFLPSSVRLRLSKIFLWFSLAEEILNSRKFHSVALQQVLSSILPPKVHCSLVEINFTTLRVHWAVWGLS